MIGNDKSSSNRLKQTNVINQNQKLLAYVKTFLLIEKELNFMELFVV